MNGCGHCPYWPGLMLHQLAWIPLLTVSETQTRDRHLTVTNPKVLAREALGILIITQAIAIVLVTHHNKYMVRSIAEATIGFCCRTQRNQSQIKGGTSPS